MDINKLMKQMGRMQADMKTTQDALAAMPVQASAGGGKVVVTGTAAGDITGIKIDPAVVDPTDVEILEDLILTGVRQMLTEGRKAQEKEMKKVTGGMGLPPGMGF